LLKAQKEYWRKSYTVRWTKLGGESTRFFHAAATERFRINTITSLDTKEGRTISSHTEKAAILLEEYRNRLGTSVQPQMHFNLQELITQLITQHDLEHLEGPFIKEDIHEVIKNSPPPRQSSKTRWFQWHISQKVLACHKRRYL
jgi:hypothetical protein